MKKIAAFILAATFSLSLGVTAFATEYRPSVEQKEAPELIAETVEVVDPVSGETTVVEDVVATVNVDLNVVDTLGWHDIVVTPVSQKDEAKYESISVALNEADRALKTNKFLHNVVNKYNKDPDASLEKQAEKLLKKLGYNTDKYVNPNSVYFKEGKKASDELVVRDLFDVSIFGDIEGIKQPDGTLRYGTKIVTEDGTITEDNKQACIVVKLNVGLSADEPTPILIFKCDMLDEWESMPATNVVRNADGSLTVTFERFCVVALLTADPLVGEDDDGIITSPETGVTEDDVNRAVSGVALCIVVCFVALSTLKNVWIGKRRNRI